MLATHILHFINTGALPNGSCIGLKDKVYGQIQYFEVNHPMYAPHRFLIKKLILFLLAGTYRAG